MEQDARAARSRFVKQVIASEGDPYKISRRLRLLMTQYIEGEIPITDIYKEVRKDAP